METILVKAAGLALMIFAGYGLKRLGVFRTEDAKVISRIVVHLTLPAALITGFRTFHFDASYLALIVIALVSNFALLGVGLRRTQGGDLATRGLYALNVSSYNIGCFVLPFVQSFLPPEALVGVSMFDAGNCPVNSGVAYAIVSARSSGQRVRLGFVLDKLVHSVPFMTYLTLMVLSILGITLPEPVYQVASTVGGANTFLAMVMIGMLFEVRVEREDRRLILEILAVRYGCSLAMAALVWVLPLPLLIRQVSVLAMMAPIPSVTMVYCEKCGCKPSLYGVLNSLSIAVSLLLTFPLLLVLHL
ncbi:AEC family transporter [Dysosmobacter sp. Sow4_B12]|uniref:AEC family transporter n=1 Tax=Dysosmobacter sp. Sow4_B12 TaxID=3438777 RepID=UPI003F8F827F